MAWPIQEPTFVQSWIDGGLIDGKVLTDLLASIRPYGALDRRT